MSLLYYARVLCLHLSRHSRFGIKQGSCLFCLLAWLLLLFHGIVALLKVVARNRSQPAGQLVQITSTGTLADIAAVLQTTAPC
jgi:hypothetical protein